MHLDCRHGGYQDASCSCQCPYGFMGKTCEELSMGQHFNRTLPSSFPCLRNKVLTSSGRLRGGGGS